MSIQPDYKMLAAQLYVNCRTMMTNPCLDHLSALAIPNNPQNLAEDVWKTNVKDVFCQYYSGEYFCPVTTFAPTTFPSTNPPLTCPTCPTCPTSPTCPASPTTESSTPIVLIIGIVLIVISLFSYIIACVIFVKTGTTSEKTVENEAGKMKY